MNTMDKSKEKQLEELREDLRRMGPDGTEPTYSMGCQINEAKCSVCGKSSSECPTLFPPLRDKESLGEYLKRLYPEAGDFVACPNTASDHISPPQECDPSGLRSVEWLRHRDSLRDEEVMREYEIHKNFISRMALREKQSEIIANFEKKLMDGMAPCPPEFMKVMNDNLEDLLA